MKEAQLLDLVLEQLYRSPEKEGDPLDLLAEHGVTITYQDAFRIAERLEERRLVKRKDSFGTGVTLAITSQGMEFVEGSSFANEQKPIINNHYNTTISNSTNANVVSHSTQTTITQHYGAEPERLLGQIRQSITEDKQATEQQRQDIIDSVDDIRAGLAAGRVPKVSLRHLLDIGAKLSSISNFALKLGEILD